MLSLEECRVIASETLSALMSGAALYDEPIHSGHYGWVFSYQSIKYMRTDNFRDALVGNSPILVDSRSGASLILGSGLHVEIYVENYLACGDPFKFLGRQVELFSWRAGFQKAEAIRTIRQKTALSLPQSKSHVDECLAGNTTELSCPTADIATELLEELNALGFCGKQLRD